MPKKAPLTVVKALTDFDWSFNPKIVQVTGKSYRLRQRASTTGD